MTSWPWRRVCCSAPAACSASPARGRSRSPGQYSPVWIFRCLQKYLLWCIVSPRPPRRRSGPTRSCARWSRPTSRPRGSCRRSAGEVVFLRRAGDGAATRTPRMCRGWRASPTCREIFVLTKWYFYPPPPDVAEGDPPGGVGVLVSGARLGEAPPGGLQSPPVRDLQQRLQTLNLETQRGFSLLHNSFQRRDTIGISSLQTNCLELWSYDKIKNILDWQMKVDGSKIYTPSGDPIIFPDSRFFVCVSFHLTTILCWSGASWEFDVWKVSSFSPRCLASNNAASPQKLPD